MQHHGSFWILVSVLMCNLLLINYQGCSSAQTHLQTSWHSGWQIGPTARGTQSSWSIHTRIPMSSASFIDYEDDAVAGRARTERPQKEKPEKQKMRNKFKKYMMPLLIAYKLKFFTLIPVLIGGLLLLTGATGLAGFFFALFAATLGLNKAQ